VSARGKKIARGVAIALGVIVAVVIVTIIGVVLAGTVIGRSLPPAVPAADPNPTRSYADALARVEGLKSLDDSSIKYGTVLLTHGSTVETAVVIYYGYTNNSRQVEQVADAYYRAGYNVLVPRLPGHGEADLMTDALTEATPEALVDTITNSIDAATGLGRNVEVVGLSVGGTMAEWAAFNRDEVDKVTAISPMMLPIRFPRAIVEPATQVARVLPDAFIWWDPIRQRTHTPVYGYPRLSSKSLSSFLELSFDIADKPSPRTTRMARAVLITNPADYVVDWHYAVRIFDQKIAPLAETSRHYAFERSQKYKHDVVDPGGDNAAVIDEIYRQLFPMLGLPEPTAISN